MLHLAFANRYLFVLKCCLHLCLWLPVLSGSACHLTRFLMSADSRVVNLLRSSYCVHWQNTLIALPKGPNKSDPRLCVLELLLINDLCWFLPSQIKIHLFVQSFNCVYQTSASLFQLDVNFTCLLKLPDCLANMLRNYQKVVLEYFQNRTNLVTNLPIKLSSTAHYKNWF